jgi:hypothetical protein
MTGNKQYVVLDSYADSSGIVAIYGPFDALEDAKAWPGMPGGPTGVYSTHAMLEAPEWVEDFNA